MSAKILDWWFYLSLLASLGTGLLFIFSEHEAVREAAASGSISFLGASGAILVWKALLGSRISDNDKNASRLKLIWALIGILLAASILLVGYGIGLAG